MSSKQQWIEFLGLEPHSEGGYFRRTYCSPSAFIGGAEKVMMTSIFYMLTDDSSRGYLHKNNSDILHFYHAGAALDYYLVEPDGSFSVVRMGVNPERGEVLQLLVKSGTWKASRLVSGDFSLISEAVVPGFEYPDRLLGNLENASALLQEHPELRGFLSPSL